MPILDNFRTNLERKLEGESKTAVAKKADIHRVTLHKILAGKLDPSLQMCEKIAKALGFQPPEKIFEKSRRAG